MKRPDGTSRSSASQRSPILMVQRTSLKNVEEHDKNGNVIFHQTSQYTIQKPTVPGWKKEASGDGGA